MAFVVCLLAVGGSVTWRRGVYFTGAFDPVAVAKAILSAVALLTAALHARRAPTRNRLGTRSIGLLVAYLAVTMIGAMADHSVFASAVLVGRVVIVAAVVYLLLLVHSPRTVFMYLIGAGAAFGLVAGITGLASVGSSGRLDGGLIPLHANEIAQLCGLAVIAVMWRLVHGEGRGWDVPLLAVLVALTWLTGSRTGLAALVAALAVLLLQARRIPVSVAATLLLVIPPITYLALGTDVVSHLLERGGQANVSTLSSRTVAWSAALDFHTRFWDQWFGSGLSVVKIPVIQKYRNDQILDSSWISALVQAGWLGVGLLAIWAVTSLVAAFRTRRPIRLLCTSVLVFLLGRSFLESGLIDSTVGFLVFFAVSVSAEATSFAPRRVPAAADKQFEWAVAPAG